MSGRIFQPEADPLAYLPACGGPMAWPLAERFEDEINHSLHFIINEQKGE